MSKLHVKEYKESSTLGIMIYSHFFFVCTRVATYILYPTIDESILARTRSLIFSLDIMTMIFLYFFPKFFAKENGGSRSIVLSHNDSSDGVTRRGSVEQFTIDAMREEIRLLRRENSLLKKQQKSSSADSSSAVVFASGAGRDSNDEASFEGDKTGPDRSDSSSQLSSSSQN